MGLLSDEYYNQARGRTAAQPTPTPQPAPDPQRTGQAFGVQTDEQKRALDRSLSIEETKILERNAGSPLRNFGLSLGQTVGMELPDQLTWELMGPGEKAATVAKAAPAAAWKMIKSAPKAVVRGVATVPVTVGDTWVDVLSGKRPTFESAVKKQGRVELPWLGEVPTYFQQYDDARASGLGPKASMLMVGSTALADVTIPYDAAQALKTAFQPRRVVNGKPVIDTKPIKSALVEGEAQVAAKRAPVGSVNEYYTMPKDVAKRYGGHSGNTFVKVTPAGPAGGSVEVSIVQTRGGLVQKAVDRVTKKGEAVYRGDFGPEVKKWSKTIEAGERVTTQLDEAARADVLGTVLPKASKGFEAKAITEDQLSHISKIAEVNGIPDDLATSVMRAVTGKEIVGELTQAEYVTLSQTMSKMSKMDLIRDTDVHQGMFSTYMSPQRNWMRNIEQKSGGQVRVYSDVYVPMEDAIRARKVFRDQWRAESRRVFGKYAGSKFAEERRLIFQYMEGNTSAISGNAALSAATKKELTDIANSLRGMYDELGPVFGIESDYFLQNYQPHIQKIGGIYQLYKDSKDIPKEMSFFAEKRRVGSNNLLVDDSLALFDIYLNAGSNKKFINPALQKVSEVGDMLPENLKGSVKSYVGEKLGYADTVERHINELVPRINKRLGTNLPPDTARMLAQGLMDHTYAAALGVRPDAIVRNLIQAPLLTYPRLGPKFYANAVRKALTKEGQREMVERGFSVDLGLPYGEELTKEITVAGRLKTAQRNVTQGTLKGYAWADTVNRATTYWQGKMIWDDALSRYQSGKLNWQQFEKEIDMKAFHPIDQNIIRKNMVEGKMDEAFEHYVRDIIDSTQFPYRRGSSARATFGFAGRLGTQFGQWNIEFAHTLGNWIKTGQFDKLIRFNAASSVIDRTMKETFGLDTDKWTGLSPLNPTLSPFVQSMVAIGGFLSNVREGNRQEMNENGDAIVRTAKSLGFPGVQGNRVEKFMKSYNRGPDAEGNYYVMSESGKVNDRVDFNDLWWGTLWGFPTVAQEADRRLNQDMRNDQAIYSQAKRDALQYLQQATLDDGSIDQRMMDKANELIQRYGINISAQDFDSFYIPYSERLFNSLPASLRAKYAPRVYPTQ